MENSIVIVIDLGNYKSEAQENVPFKALITSQTETEFWVKSLKTGKVYEVYHSQVLEFLEIEEIIQLIDLDQYGK